MGRGDKGKFNKRGGRGGRGRTFHAESVDEIELRNSRIAEFDEARARRRATAESDNEGGEEETEKIQRGIACISLDVGSSFGGTDGEVERQMTRKERESAEKERAAAEYRRRHELGLTEEYRRDMEKLTEVRKRREEDQKKAVAEREAAESLKSERNIYIEVAGAVDEDAGSKGDKKAKRIKKKDANVPTLDKITIKKMKPTQLKESLRVRGLDIQGNAKTLTQRLLIHEGAR